MRIVIYNKKKFTQRDVTSRIKGIIILGFCFLSLFAVWSFTLPQENKKQEISQEMRVLILKQENEFSKEKLIEYMKELNIDHPHIVYGQFKLESGNFTSGRFKKHRNLLGMKRSTTRVTTATDYDDSGFAIYDSWKSAVLDYCFWQASFARGLTEKEYLQYLEVYCDEPGYAELVMKNSNRLAFSAK